MIDLNIPQPLNFFTTGLDVERSHKLMKDIMFNPPKDLSDRVKNYIKIIDAIGSLKQ